MTTQLTALHPNDVAARLKAGRAVLIDIREADEFARSHIAGAISQPLSALEAMPLKLVPGRAAIFTCRTGMRTGANCDRLARRVEGDAFVLEGGLDAWAKAGLPVTTNAKAPLEMMRQVQIAAGTLVLIGVALGFLVHPALFAIAAFVGAGLTFAGITGFCGMSKLLAIAPWNRPARI